MIFTYDASILADFPSLSTLAFVARGIFPLSGLEGETARLLDRARARLSAGNEGGFPEIQAWRRAYSEMGLKPTQYRCASEALLRRLRMHGDLPKLHPLVDFCNAASAAYAVPIAAFDLARIAGPIEVRRAQGSERFDTFAGETEVPAPGEVVFADAEGRAHARRWTNRQSGYSAVRDDTGAALIVAEALHDSGQVDLLDLGRAMRSGLIGGWPHVEIEPVALP